MTGRLVKLAASTLFVSLFFNSAYAQTSLPSLVPTTCGGVEAEAYLLDGMGIGGEAAHELASGSATKDPDVFFGVGGTEHAYTKNADGTIDYFFDGEAAVSSISDQIGVSIPNISAIAGGAADQTDAAEFWRIVIKLDGIPGETYDFNVDNGAAHEFTHTWAEDSSGAVIYTSLGEPNTANGWVYGARSTASTASTNGATSIIGDTEPPLSITIPASNADGIFYLKFLMLDPQVGWGGIDLTGAPECPAPSLSMTKVADDQGPHLTGDVITYMYTVTNDGNRDISDVAMTDTHNGSDPAPIPGNEMLLTDVAPLGDSTDALTDGSWDILGIGDSVTFTGTYTVTQTDVDTL